MSAKIRYAAYLTLVNQPDRATMTESDELLAALPQRSWLAQIQQKVAGWLPGATKQRDPAPAVDATGAEIALSSNQL